MLFLGFAALKANMDFNNKRWEWIRHTSPTGFKNIQFPLVMWLHSIRNIRNVIWLVVSTSLKNMKVSWGYYSQQKWKVIKFMFQTTNQIYPMFTKKSPFRRVSKPPTQGDGIGFTCSWDGETHSFAQAWSHLPRPVPPGIQSWLWRSSGAV